MHCLRRGPIPLLRFRPTLPGNAPGNSRPPEARREKQAAFINLALAKSLPERAAFGFVFTKIQLPDVVLQYRDLLLQLSQQYLVTNGGRQTSWKINDKGVGIQAVRQCLREQ